MRLSIFMSYNECFAATDGMRLARTCDANNKASEVLVSMLELLIASKVTHIFFPSGPHSFTSTRIIHSIVSGLKIVNPNMKLTAVSCFLTYAAALKRNDPYTIAISTRKGDFYCMDCIDGILQNYRVAVPDGVVFYDSAEFYANLASLQLNIQNNSLFEKNKELVTDSTDINYSATPVYKTL